MFDYRSCSLCATINCPLYNWEGLIVQARQCHRYELYLLDVERRYGVFECLPNWCNGWLWRCIRLLNHQQLHYAKVKVQRWFVDAVHRQDFKDRNYVFNLQRFSLLISAISPRFWGETIICHQYVFFNRLQHLNDFRHVIRQLLLSGRRWRLTFFGARRLLAVISTSNRNDW